MRSIRRGWAELSFEKKLSVVIVPLLVALIGAGVPLLMAGRDNSPAPNVVVTIASKQIPRFKGVAGHLEQSRAILDFLHQNDGEPVRLEVGFPEVHSEDFIVEETARGDGTNVQTVTYVQLFHECTPGLPPGDYPTFAKGCMATSLELSGPPTGDSSGWLEHGVPVLHGYFAVDVTSELHMGVTPIRLKPLTFEQAKASDAGP